MEEQIQMPSSIVQELMKRKEENGSYIAAQQKLSIPSVKHQATPLAAIDLLKKYPTIKDFSMDNNPDRQYVICLHPEQCVLGSSPTLALLDQAFGPSSSAIWLVPQISDLSLSCGLKEDASEKQMVLVTTAIISRYFWLKTDEIMLFFFNFKAGFYEKFFSYFDPQTIIRSIPSFLHERQQIIDVYERELQEAKTKQDNAPNLSLEEINKHYFKTETLNKILHLKY